MDYMDFRKRLACDEAFRAKFEDCRKLDTLIETAAREGYVFTAEDVRDNTEVLPEELHTAAGGLNVANVFDSNSKIISWGK